MSENNQELDRNTLFLQALQERMAQMVVDYETRVAELRVEFTFLTQERDNLLKAIEARDEQVGQKAASVVQEKPAETD